MPLGHDSSYPVSGCLIPLGGWGVANDLVKYKWPCPYFIGRKSLDMALRNTLVGILVFLEKNFRLSAI